MITKNNQTQPLTEQKLPISSSSSLAALEAVAHRQDDDEDERDDDAQNDQLDLHVLQPHLPPHPGALLPEILCLQAEFWILITISYRHAVWRTYKQETANYLQVKKQPGTVAHDLMVL